MESLIGLFELPEDLSTADDEHFIDVEDTPGKHQISPLWLFDVVIIKTFVMRAYIGYQGSFNQLFSASKNDPDPFKGEIPNAKYFLSKSLENLSSSIPSKVKEK